MGTSAWIECELADVCSSIDYGYTAAASDDSQGAQFLRITDIVQPQLVWDTVPHVEANEVTLSKYRLDDGDIVLARTGASTGASAYIQNPPEAIFASYLVRLKIKPTFDPRFVSYYLKSDTFWSYIRGVLGDKSAQPNASASTMVRAPFRAPRDIAEQRQISGILGALDDKIELNRRMSQTLESMARALFKSWFVDFDPVHAKSEGRDLDESAHVSVASVGDLMEVNPPRSLPKGQVAPYLDMANVSTSGQTPSGIVPRPFSSGSRFVNGDTLVARITPCLENGKAAYVDFLDNGQIGWGSTEFVVLRPKAPLPSEFAYCLVRDEAFRDFAIQRMSGTSGRQRVPTNALADFVVGAPSPDVARAFGGYANPLLARARAADVESGLLARLRDALLPRLLSGDLQAGSILGDGAPR